MASNSKYDLLMIAGKSSKIESFGFISADLIITHIRDMINSGAEPLCLVVGTDLYYAIERVFVDNLMLNNTARILDIDVMVLDGKSFDYHCSHGHNMKGKARMFFNETTTVKIDTFPNFDGLRDPCIKCGEVPSTNCTLTYCPHSGN